MTETAEILAAGTLRLHLNLPFDGPDTDTFLNGKIEAARRFVEGYVGPLDDFPGSIPGDLVEALKMVAGHFYENREATFVGQGGVAEVPFGLFDLIGPWRRWEF